MTRVVHHRQYGTNEHLHVRPLVRARHFGVHQLGRAAAEPRDDLEAAFPRVEHPLACVGPEISVLVASLLKGEWWEVLL